MFSTVEGYKELEFQLYGEMIQLRELHKALKNEQEVERISKIIDTLKTRTFRVAVVGEFKRGKSSLINALLGSAILPADVTPATATINRITYGATPGITVCYHDGTRENIDIHQLADYVTMLTPEGLQRALSIKEAIVFYPTTFCQNHIELIDTPGLSDNARMTDITMSFLRDVDAAIVVISALAPFSQTEAEFVADLILSGGQTNLIFVVTYIDEVDEDRQDELVETIHKRIRDNVLRVVQKNTETADKAETVQWLLQNAPIFGVSSKLALKAFVSNSSRMLKESRFEPFKEELYKILTARQGIHTLNLSVNSILSGCDTYEASADAELAKLDKELETMSDILHEIGRFNSRSVADVMEAFRKLREEVSEEVKTACEQMRTCFLKMFQEVFSSLQLRTGLTIFELQKAVTEVSFKCYTIANEERNAAIKSMVIHRFKKGISDLIAQRRALVQDRLKEMNTAEWKTTQLFTVDPGNVLDSFGYPSFMYQVPVVPQQKNCDLGIYRQKAANAVHVSLQTLEMHWGIYCDTAAKWWVRAFTEEATAMQENLARASVELEDRKKEREFQAIQINCQKNNIRTIRSRVETIRHRIQSL